MKKKKQGVSLMGIAFFALIVLVVFFLVRLSLHRSPAVELPQFDPAASGGDMVSDTGQEAIRRVEVTPETVQRVIERLARPDEYSRSIMIERYWLDGSGQTTAQVRVADGWTRIDVAGGNDEQRHIITGEGRSWIWYGSGGPVYSGAAALTADEEQSIPTYEDILLLESEDIAVADYRALDAVNCIYVETEPDPSGYIGRWWVSVDNGLLVAAERLRDEAVVYRMSGLSVDVDADNAEAFVLPDQQVLYQRQTEISEGETALAFS